MYDFSSSSDRSSSLSSECAKQIRRGELPRTLAEEFMDLDEFFSETGTSSSQTSHVERGRATNCESTRSSKDVTKVAGLRRLVTQYELGSRLKVRTSMARDDDPERVALDRNILDAMNKAYDHNVCLERFISEQQGRINPSAVDDDDSADVELHLPNARCLPLDDPTYQASVQPLDRTGHRTIPPRSCTSRSSDSRSACSHSHSPSFCPTCSSANPRSTEEDTSSNKSDSLGSGENFSASVKGKKDLALDSGVVRGRDPLYQASPASGPSSGSPVAVDASSESGIVADVSTLNGSNNRASSVAGNLSDSTATGKRYKGGKIGRKRRRGYIYDPKPVLRKMPKISVPTEKKDDQYWERRQRNNDAARRSRDFRRRKELETQSKLDALEKENKALRNAIELLVRRNEYLGCVLEDRTTSGSQVPDTLHSNASSDSYAPMEKICG